MHDRGADHLVPVGDNMDNMTVNTGMGRDHMGTTTTGVKANGPQSKGWTGPPVTLRLEPNPTDPISVLWTVEVVKMQRGTCLILLHARPHGVSLPTMTSMPRRGAAR